MKKMIQTVWIVLTVFFFVLVAQEMVLARTFLRDTRSVRCSGRVVRVNDLARDVLERCGEPFRRFNRDADEIWVYNFGQGRRVYFFTFFRDNLRRIQSQRCDIEDPDCVYLGP